jgi:stage III sporulation protein AF
MLETIQNVFQFDQILLDIVRDWVKNLVVIILIVVLLEMLLPSSGIKKYVQVVMGLFIIVTVLNPIVNFFQKDYVFSHEMWKAYNPIIEQQIVDQEEIAGRNRDHILQLYKKRINEQVEKIVTASGDYGKVKADVSIEENPDEEGFASIKSITVYIQEGEQSSGEDAVKPVVINPISEEPQGKATKVSQGYLGYEAVLQEKIGNYWGVDPENIKIVVEEKKEE